MTTTETEKATLELDGLTVSGDVVGAGSQQPWHPHATVFEYRVTVTDRPTTYECPAWGSIADYADGRTDTPAIVAMVLGELLSAAYDPDEFWAMAIGSRNEGEAVTREQVASVNRLLDAAVDLGPALERNADAIQALDS